MLRSDCSELRQRALFRGQTPRKARKLAGAGALTSLSIIKYFRLKASDINVDNKFEPFMYSLFDCITNLFHFYSEFKKAVDFSYNVAFQEGKVNIVKENIDFVKKLLHLSQKPLYTRLLS